MVLHNIGNHRIQYMRKFLEKGTKWNKTVVRVQESITLEIQTSSLQHIFSLHPPFLRPPTLAYSNTSKLPAHTGAIRLRSDSVVFVSRWLKASINIFLKEYKLNLSWN
jgi:hypothetical protein